MVEEPDSENSLFSEPLKMRTPSARALGPRDNVDQAALGLEIVEQEPPPLEILQRLEILKQVGMAAHDQAALVVLAAGPAGEPCFDDLLGELVELGLAGGERPFEIRLGLGQRPPADMGIEEVGRLGE